MLKIYDASDSDVLYPLPLNKADWYIVHSWDGLDSLTFDIPPKHDSYPRIAEEVRITDGQNRYIVKDIDECSTVSTVVCDLDMDDWKETLYPTFRTTDKYLSEVLDQIKPAGWKIINAGVSSKRATVEASEGDPLENVTPYDLLGRISEVYEVVFQYNTIDRELTVVDPTLFQASGEYLMEKLNLKSIKYTGNTQDFATRLYAQGKEGLTFADINDGKDYVEDLSYSNRVISVGWKDERYTVKENLLKAAKEKLKKLAFPVRSYECSVLDLAKLHPEYTFLSFALFRVVTLVDRRRKTRVDHQIVEYREYPDAPEKNVVTLSSTVPKIQNTIDQIKVDMVEQDNTVRGDMQKALENATDLLTGAKGGNVKVTIKNGKPTEILIMDTDDVNTCKRVWRWNIAGFGYSDNGINGPYTTAITMDGRIVADFITAGTMSANIIRGGVLQSQNGTLRFDLNNANMSVYNASGQLIMRFNSAGLHFYDNGTYIGKIGTNKWKTRPEIKGLVFDLDTDGGYLAWAKRVNPSDPDYTTMLYFFPDDRIDSKGLHLGTDLYTHNYSIHLGTQNHAYSHAWSNGAGFAAYDRFILADTADNTIAFFQPGQIDFYKDLYMHNHNIHNQSDERLKTNIRSPTISALDILCRLQCVQFDWLEGGHESLGVIAQQVQQIAPELVSEDENGVLNINQTRLIQYLLAAIQELADLVIPSPMKALFDKQEYASHYTEEEKQKFLQQILEKNRLVPVPPDPPITLK